MNLKGLFTGTTPEKLPELNDLLTKTTIIKQHVSTQRSEEDKNLG
jgi:hypothetical protein